MADISVITNLFGQIGDDDSKEYLAKLSKQLVFMLQNLDSLNVTSIDTEITTITTGDGSTVITGPQIIMKDADENIRLVMGLNTTTDEFEFNIFNEAGDLTLTIDGSGNIVANSLTIGAGSTGVANLSDSGDLAVLDTVSSVYIDDNAIIAPKIAAGAVIAGKLAADSVLANNIEAGAVTASKIDVNTLSAISADLGTVTAGDIYGVRYFGFGASTAYMEIGAGGGNLADLTLNRSASDIFFKIEDSIPGVQFEADAAVGDTEAFLISYNGTTDMLGTWEYENDEVISFITASTGLSGTGDGPSRTLSLDLSYTDDRYCVNESSQQMGFQVVGGALEVFIGGVFQFTLTP